MIVTTGLHSAQRRLVVGLPPPAFNVVCVAGLPIRRTHKLLIAIARGHWVVSVDWLTASAAAGECVDPSNYELTEHAPGCRSSRLAGGGTQLRGLTIAVGGELEMSHEELRELIRAAGGEVIFYAPDDYELFESSLPLAVKRPASGRWQSCTESSLYDSIVSGEPFCEPEPEASAEEQHEEMMVRPRALRPPRQPRERATAAAADHAQQRADNNSGANSTGNERMALPLDDSGAAPLHRLITRAAAQRSSGVHGCFRSYHAREGLFRCGGRAQALS